MGFHGNFKPLVVRSDQGSAFVSHHFREFLSAHQIHQSLACTYTPQQNAHAERFFGVAFSTARVLLAAANLPPTFHPFALQTAVWIHNRLPIPYLRQPVCLFYPHTSATVAAGPLHLRMPLRRCRAAGPRLFT